MKFRFRPPVPVYLSLLWALASGSVIAQPLYSVLTAERLWQLVQIGEPAVSPDGRWAAFTVTAWAANAELPSIDLWLVATHGKDDARQLTRNPGADFDPAWAPDSQSLVYASSREGQDGSQIWLLNLRGGEPLPLTELPLSAQRPRFSPDGASVFFESRTFPDLNDNFEALSERLSRQSQRSRAVAIESRPAPERSDDPELVDHIFRLDLETGKTTDLMPGFSLSNGIRPFHWDLSPNGELLAFTANTSPPPFAHRNGDVFLLSIREPRQEPVNLTADNPGNDFRPVFSRAGNALIYGRRVEVDSLSQFNQLIRHELRDGARRELTDGKTLSPRRWQTAGDGRQVYFTAQQRGRWRLFRASGGRSRALTEEGSVSAFALGPDDELFYLHENLFSPPALFAADRNAAHPRRLTHFNAPLMGNTRTGSYREIELSGANDTVIHGFVVYPPGYSEEHRWPLIIALHGGPHSAWLDEFNWRWNLGLMASQGYLVAAVNFHGSTGYGQAFAESINGNPLATPAEDILKVTEALRRDPSVDGERLVVVGGSYGGLLAYRLLTRTDQYQAAVIHAGVFDLASQYGTDFPWGRERTWGALPWENPGHIDRLSPSRLAAQIQTPVLLLHGVNDTRVAPMHSRYAHNVLTRRGVPSRLVLFADTAHSIASPPAALRWWQELFQWLQRYAPPGPRGPD